MYRTKNLGELRIENVGETENLSVIYNPIDKPDNKTPFSVKASR